MKKYKKCVIILDNTTERIRKMVIRDWRGRWQEVWLAMTIKKKLSLFAGLAFGIILLSLLFDIWVVDFSANDFGVILDENARCSELDRKSVV